MVLQHQKQQSVEDAALHRKISPGSAGAQGLPLKVTLVQCVCTAVALSCCHS